MGENVLVEEKDKANLIRCKCHVLTPQTVVVKLAEHVDLEEEFMIRVVLRDFYGT